MNENRNKLKRKVVKQIFQVVRKSGAKTCVAKSEWKRGTNILKRRQTDKQRQKHPDWIR